MNKNIKKSSRTKNIELLNQTTKISYASIESWPDSLPDNDTFSSVKTSINIEEDEIIFLSEEIMEKEREIFKASLKVDFSNPVNNQLNLNPVNNQLNLNSRNANGIITIVDDINPGIEIYEQDTSGTCAAQSICFLYIYTMAIGVNHSLNDISWWEFAKSSDAPPLANSIIDWLERLLAKITLFEPNVRKIDYTKSFNDNLKKAIDSIFLLHNALHSYTDTAIFSRTFMMWAGFYAKLWPEKDIDDYFPYRDGGSGPGYILNGLEKFGAIITDPVVVPRAKSINPRSFVYIGKWTDILGKAKTPDNFLENYGPYHFYSFINGDVEHSRKLYRQITYQAFGNNVIHPTQKRTDYLNKPDLLDDRDFLIKDEVSQKISLNIEALEKALARNTKTTLGIQLQQGNGFKRFRIATNQETIITTLRAGYPITFGIDLFNYKLYSSSKGGRIPFDNDLEWNKYVMRFTDSSQKKKDKVEGHQVVAIGCIKSPDGKLYLKIRNSWGSDWGENGHFYIPITYATQNDSIKGVVNISNPTVITLLDDPFPLIPKVWFKDYNNTPRPTQITITSDDSANKNENIVTTTPTYTHFEKINLMNYLYIENIDISKLTIKIDSIPSLRNNATLSGSYLIIDRCDNSVVDNAGGCIITVNYKFSKTESVIFKWDTVYTLYFCYRYPDNNFEPITNVLNIKIQYPPIKIGKPYIYLHNYTNVGIGDNITYDITGDGEQMAKIRFNPPYILNFIQKGAGYCTLTARRADFIKTSIKLQWDLCGVSDAGKVWCS